MRQMFMLSTNLPLLRIKKLQIIIDLKDYFDNIVHFDFWTIYGVYEELGNFDNISTCRGFWSRKTMKFDVLALEKLKCNVSLKMNAMC